MSFLFRPVDIAPLVFFRVVFGVLGFADLLGVWTYYHLYQGYFDPANFQFKYLGFEWAKTLPEPFMSLVFLVSMAAALAVAIGWRYRVCTVVFALGFTWQFLLEKALYLNHGYLFIWISCLMIFLPAHQNGSADALQNRATPRQTVARWQVWILPFLMGVVYFYGGIAKLNSDWLLDANPLKHWLDNSVDLPLLGWVFRLDTTAFLMAWGGTLLDLTAAFLLLFRRTRVWALGFILFFHLTNTLIFQIGIFPWLSIALSLMFFPPEMMRRWFAILCSKVKPLGKLSAWWERRLAEREGNLSETERAGNQPVATSDLSVSDRLSPSQKWVAAFLILLVAFHLLLPLRHHLFKGDVAWTEEGHRFSWRMMLRSKRGYGYFTVTNPATGESVKIRPAEYLTDRQDEKIYTHPDMILQFAHHLRDLWKKKGVAEPEVYASIRVSLNARPTQPYVDSKVNLAKEKWRPLRESDWVMPFEEK